MSQDTDFTSPKSEGEFYTTDSEFYDPTSAGEEGRSTQFEDSQELQSKKRRGVHSVTTSQELGEKLSRDIRNFHSTAKNVASRGSTMDRHDEGNLKRTASEASFTRDNVQNEVFLEFDNIFKQHGQYLSASEDQPSSLERTTDNRRDKRNPSPDSIEVPKPKKSESKHHHHHRNRSTSVAPKTVSGVISPPTPPRFTPPPPPPRPPKPDRLSKPAIDANKEV